MILVDAIAPCLRTRTWRHRENCHLFCDGDLDELHAFAMKLGLKRRWFQDKGDLPHYDLTRSKRDVAVSLGAVEADRQTTVDWIKRWRQKRQNPGGVMCVVGVDLDTAGVVRSLRLIPKTKVHMSAVSMGEEYTLQVQSVGRVTAHVIGYEADAEGMLKEINLTTAAAIERSPS